MTAKKRVTAKGMDANESDVRLWLIEHGGAPFVTTSGGKGNKAWSASSPQFPDPLPSLGDAMKGYPCEGHGEREPAICATAKAVKKRGKK